MRKRVVGSEVQLEEGILLRRVSPERPLYGRLAAEGVDRFADGLGANVSGILYGVEMGGWELTRRCTFLCVDRILHFKDYWSEMDAQNVVADASHAFGELLT